MKTAKLFLFSSVLQILLQCLQIMDGRSSCRRHIIARIQFLKFKMSGPAGFPTFPEAQQFLAEEREKNTAAVVLDVPLLIECGWHTKMDSVWLVKVPKSVQIQRAMLRDGATEEAVTARINAQMSLADKEKFADVVIDNSGTLDSTKAQVTAQLQNVLGAV